MKRRYKILQVIYSFGVEGSGGGIGRFGIELARYLDPDLFESAICALWSLGTEAENQRIQRLYTSGLPTFTAAHWDGRRPYRSFLAAYQGLGALFSRYRFDLLHSHTEFGDMALLPFKFRRPSPRIARTVHNGHPLEWRKRPFRRYLLTKFLYPLLFDLEAGVNKNIVANLDRRRLFRLLGRQAVLLPNAISLDRFSGLQVSPSKIKKNLRIDPSATLIGTVGRVSEGKGLEILIQAADEVHQGNPEIKFLIVGDGEQLPELQRSVKSLNLDQTVFFSGPQSGVEEIIASLDLLVLPSLWEGLSSVIMEAMAAGIPVIATDIPGNRELIIHGENGWLVPPGDPAAIASRIKRSLADRSQSKNLAANARQDVNNFSIQSVSALHTRIYQELLQ